MYIFVISLLSQKTSVDQICDFGVPHFVATHGINKTILTDLRQRELAKLHCKKYKYLCILEQMQLLVLKKYFE